MTTLTYNNFYINKNDTHTTKAIILSLNPDDILTRSPIDLVCVIDVSGSMSTPASISNNEGFSESNGLNILDLVKHSIKTIAKTLNKEDRIAIVKYNNEGHVVQTLVNIDTNGLTIINNKLDSLIAGGQTNIWDGLYKGMELLRTREKEEMKGRNSSIILLTDGIPNITPPRGHGEMLKKYKDEGHLTCSIDTFGFGYNLKSDILKEIADEGNGNYNFIPDSTFTGTVFVNTIANLITKKSNQVTFQIELVNDVKINEVKAAYGTNVSNLTKSSWGLQIDSGILQYGQKKVVVFNLDIPNELLDKTWFKGTVKYDDIIEGSVVIEMGENIDAEINTVFHLSRMKAVEHINQLIKMPYSVDTVKYHNEYLVELKSLINDDNIDLCNLYKDMSGQVSESVMKEVWYNKWGIHYLPALAGSHQHQICSNFKDPGLQNYGGTLTKKERDEAEDIFINMPAPTPTNTYSGYRGFSQSSQPRAVPQVSMDRYMNRCGGCFDGDCPVILNNSYKKIYELEKDDMILGGDTFYKIKCIVKIECSSSKEMVLLGDNNKLCITPYHPIKYTKQSLYSELNQWTYPVDVKKSENMDVEYVYNIVLEKPGSYITIDGIDCCTLGHELEDNDVIKHDFYGKKIIDELEQFVGWDEGLVSLKDNCEIRDSITNNVIGLIK